VFSGKNHHLLLKLIYFSKNQKSFTFSGKKRAENAKETSKKRAKSIKTIQGEKH
jgi:hypothetical protein